MPPDSTKNEHRPAREDHFWDRPIKQPAAEESSAHHLQHFGKLPIILAALGQACNNMPDVLDHII